MYGNRRRFIAGAVCPRCAKMDKLVVYRQDDRDYRECVSCGFREQMFFPAKVREPDTRVNRTAAERLAETRPVRLLGAQDADEKDA